VDLDAARDFLRENHRGVLATRRSDGRIQQSPVIAAVDAEGRVVVSSRETAIKTKNLRRDPWAQLCAFTDRFFGPWVYVEGTAEVVSLPEAMDPLIDYYKRFPGENPTGTTTACAWNANRACCCASPSNAPGPTARARSRGFGGGVRR
jgi:PPOX class probable F420-dependent enzyme